MEKLLLWFNEISNDDVAIVGGKNASLGEMYSKLTKKGIKIPNGFAVTAHAYARFLQFNQIEEKIEEVLEKLNVESLKSLQESGKRIRTLIEDGKFPEDLQQEILQAYRGLSKQFKTNEADVAVRSSATAEDLPTASFAGQLESFLNVKGDEVLLKSIKSCFASLFTDRAISYREDKGFGHFEVAVSVGVQKMVRSDKACSGVMFSIDTETGFDKLVVINASYGLGEAIVKGQVNADEYRIFKPLMQQYKPIIRKRLGEKKAKIIYAGENNDRGQLTKTVKVNDKERTKYCLSESEILQLAKWGVEIEAHYSERNRKYTPMDMEWAKDGISGELFIVQARPETIFRGKKSTTLEIFDLKEKGKILTTGMAVGEKVGQGKANVIKNVKNISQFKQGEVLVTEMTDPDWEPAMKLAAAIVTEKGSRTSHAAIVSRELGIPCIVGTKNATTVIKQRQNVTISCSEGEIGKVYDKLLKFEKKEIDLQKVPETKTQIMLNIGNPDEAFEKSFLPNKGVGLARLEFIILSQIKIHPLALINYPKLKDKKAKKRIAELTEGYTNKNQFFVDKLAEGIGTIAAAFHPHDVIVRMSDFKSNEYAMLIGGKEFEPEEENPMLGWRGAARYYSQQFEPAFKLECLAFKKAREVFGLKNIKIMIPMCRTVEEGKTIIEKLKENGLEKGRDGLEVYVMCEIPSNVIMAEEFAQIFDGFSIGSNDLTQLTLGLDRDSELVSHLFNERNDAVKRMVSMAISTAKRLNKKIGICGDAPSTYPEFAQFLVTQGIDSISLTPDAVVKTILKVAEMEKKMKK